MSAAGLRQLADWIDSRLDNEHVDRQTVCEDVAARLRHLAKQDAAGQLEDVRVTVARETLAQLPAAEDNDRPHYWIGRLHGCAGSLLEAWPPAAAGLTAQQRGQLGLALADAITYRDPTGSCTACETHSTGLCADHAGDLDRTDAYLSLAEALGLELDL